MNKTKGYTYSSILSSLCVTALERLSVTLVLQTLWCDETLNLGCLGVWLLAFALWLDFATNDVFTDLQIQT
jgi:hypothetical protein